MRALTRPRDLGRAMLAEWRFLLGRGRSTLIVLLGLPLVYPLAISWLYSEHAAVERPVLVVDDDNSALSRRLLMDLEATREIRVAGRPETPDEGWAALRAGRAEALVWIPADLSRDVKRGRQGHVKLWVNAGNMLTYAVALPAVSAVTQHLDEELGARHLQRRGVPGDRAGERVLPIARDERFLFQPALAYGPFLIPAVMVVVLQQLVLVALAFSAGFGRETGLSFDPRRPFLTAWGKALAHLPFHLLAVGLLAFGVFPAFGWPALWPWSLAALMAAFVAAMLPLGVLVAAGARDRYTAFLLLMLMSTPIFMASGYAWPGDQLPAYLRVAMAALPLTPALAALRVVTMKSGDLRAVAPQLLHLLACAAGWTLVAVAARIAVDGRRPAPAGAAPGTDPAGIAPPAPVLAEAPAPAPNP